MTDLVTLHTDDTGSTYSVGMTDSEKLDAILASQLRAEDAINNVIAIATPILEHIKPTIDALEKSPIGKMILGKVNRV